MSNYHHPAAVAKLFESLVPVVCPDRGSGLASEIVAHTELSLRALPKHIRAALVAGSLTYDLGAIAYPLVAMRRASKLDFDDRRRYFELWHEGHDFQRQFVKAVKGFICMGYYEQESVKQKLGYSPEVWIDKVKKRRLSTFSAAIEAHEEALRAPDPLPRGVFDRAAEVRHAP